MLLPDLALPLLLTLVCELPVVFLFGYRSKLQLLSAVAVNLITNPVLNLILWLNFKTGLITQTSLLIITLELLVVISEAGMLAFAWRIRYVKMLTLSLCMNLASFLIGLIIL